jgi:hypothetical protein
MKTIDAKSMLIGFLLCAVGFLTMGQTSGNLGHIEVNSITIKDNNGTDYSGWKENVGGWIKIYNSDGKQIMFAGSSYNDGSIKIFNKHELEAVDIGKMAGGGYIKTYNNDGKRTMYAGTNSGNTNENGTISGNLYGLIETYNNDGKKTMYAGGQYPEGDNGTVKTFNKFENISTVLGHNDGDGVLNLFDRYGDYGWGRSGKK